MRRQGPRKVNRLLNARDGHGALCIVSCTEIDQLIMAVLRRMYDHLVRELPSIEPIDTDVEITITHVELDERKPVPLEPREQVIDIGEPRDDSPFRSNVDRPVG
jgi:hypothetical protein